MRAPSAGHDVLSLNDVFTFSSRCYTSPPGNGGPHDTHLYFSTALTEILLRLNCPLLKGELTPGNIGTAHRSNTKCLNDDDVEESGTASMPSHFHIIYVQH